MNATTWLALAGVTTVIVAVLAVAFVASIQAIGRRQRVALAAETRATVAELRAQAVAERDAAVKAALDQVAVLNRETVGAQVDAGRHDLDARKAAIDVQVETMRDELARIEDLLGSLGRSHERSIGAISAQLSAHAESTAKLASTAQGLREALANPKARGQWGERMAEDVLRLAGFQEHVNYVKQTAVEGGRSIPDFTFPLPKGRVLYMDVKFPLTSYLRHLEAQTDAERTLSTRAFLSDVRTRVRELARRDYLDRSRPTIDQLLLFIPNESVSAFIHEHDPELIEDALRQRVVLCSPTSLFAFLVVIRQAAENFAVEETADEILRLFGAFATQYEKFAEALEGVGKRFEAAQKALEELSGTRRRQLEKPLQRIEGLRRQLGLAAAPDLVPGADVIALDPGA